MRNLDANACRQKITSPPSPMQAKKGLSQTGTYCKNCKTIAGPAAEVAMPPAAKKKASNKKKRSIWSFTGGPPLPQTVLEFEASEQ